MYTGVLPFVSEVTAARDIISHLYHTHDWNIYIYTNCLELIEQMAALVKSYK